LNLPGKLVYSTLAMALPGSQPDYQITFKDGANPMYLLGGGPNNAQMIRLQPPDRVRLRSLG
jgi:hypothetical protein